MKMRNLKEFSESMLLQWADCDKHDKRYERKAFATLLWAIRKNNISVLQLLSNLGEYIRHVTMNYKSYLSHLQYGYEKITIDKNGWLERIKWEQTETIEFRSKYDQHFCKNYVSIGMGNNGKWAWGYHYELAPCSEGGCCGIMENNPGTTKKEAIENAIEYISSKHTRILNKYPTDLYSRDILRLILAYKQPKQMELF